MTLGHLLDGLIIMLLGVAIGYAVVLNRRLRLLRDSRGELERVVAALTDAIGQADAGLNEIHHAADSVGRELDRKIDGAREHAGELGMLLDRTESAANRLEAVIGLSRKIDPGGFPGGLAGALAAAAEAAPAAEEKPTAPQAKSRPKARPTPARLFVGPAEEQESLSRAGGGSIVKALRGMR